MAVFAPVFFNLAMIIYVVYQAPALGAIYALRRIYFASGPVGWLMVLIPAAVGFVAGINGSARLLGYAFWTNHPNERSVIATVLVWGVFLLAFGVGLVFLSAA